MYIFRYMIPVRVKSNAKIIPMNQRAAPGIITMIIRPKTNSMTESNKHIHQKFNVFLDCTEKDDDDRLFRIK